MGVVAANQKTVQSALVSVLGTAVSGAGKQYAVVHGNRAASSQSSGTPALWCVSAGERRTQPWAGTPKFMNYFRFRLETFIDDVDAEQSWLRSNVEDKINDCCQALAQAISDNRTNAAWGLLYFDEGYSTIEPGKLDQFWGWLVTHNIIVEVEDTIT
jgi:hypothetical protein